MVIGTFRLFDETRSSLLSSSVVKVHHSFGRAHEKQVVRGPERGVSAERSSRWPSDRGDPVPGRPMLRRPRRSRKGRRPVGTPIRGGGAEETRTPDVLLAKEVLYQLSYGPRSAAPLGAGSEGIIRCPEQRVWAFLDSNQRPLPYQGSALTS